jgi:hypothetical protein
MVGIEQNNRAIISEATVLGLKIRNKKLKLASHSPLSLTVGNIVPE